ncbi:hypothetical protein HJG60_010352 [Phyllostomus discolor]|uniref:Uncharacterized protein n=1 Tax=Phyllostomus discolor TaxID=89673 RepID=A0A834EKB0_9CHIR|nr:hypothetical protein HJG60_010352 [Phyllostomus discolor]
MERDPPQLSGPRPPEIPAQLSLPHPRGTQGWMKVEEASGGGSGVHVGELTRANPDAMGTLPISVHTPWGSLTGTSSADVHTRGPGPPLRLVRSAALAPLVSPGGPWGTEHPGFMGIPPELVHGGHPLGARCSHWWPSVTSSNPGFSVGDGLPSVGAWLAGWGLSCHCSEIINDL